MLGTPVRFDYTGSAQTYTVPVNCLGLQIDCIGAAGGNGNTATGGKGGRVQCRLTVTAGQLLYLYVGGQGTYSSSVGAKSGGWNGGGTGYVTQYTISGSTYNYNRGAGGGGASDIRLNGTALPNRIIVAGAGAGGLSFVDNGALYAGGAGGGTTGESGKSAQGETVAGGGTQSAGGAGVTDSLFPEYKSTAGTLGIGGNSANGGICSGSGGGGGYYGGGGGCRCSGGGGSSYTDSTICTDVTHTQGYSEATGNGWIILTPILPDIYTRDSSKDKTASMPTTTYEAFIAAGYKTDGSVSGVYLKDLNQ